MELTLFELAFLGGWYALSYAVLKSIEIRIINTRLKEENKRLREGGNTGKGVTMKVKLTNDKLRRAFLDNYEAWGVWFYEPRLGVNYYRCSFPDNSGIVVEEQTSAGLHSPRVVTSVRYHRVSPYGKYDMEESSMADMIRNLRNWTGTVEIGTSDMTS